MSQGTGYEIADRDRRNDVTFDLYAWKAPRDLEPDEASALLAAWSEAGADPGDAPFEASDDVAWFHRELTKDLPAIETSSDAPRNASERPIWLETDSPSPARLVAIRLPRGPMGSAHEALETILGLAAKYDLVLFDPHGPRSHLPLEALADHASATFWPRGAIRAFVVGGIGAVAAVGAWTLDIFLLSWIVIVVGGFLFVLAVFTFVHEGRLWWRRRGGPGADAGPG